MSRSHRSAGLNQLGPKKTAVPFGGYLFPLVKRKGLNLSQENVDGINAWRRSHGIAELGHRHVRTPTDKVLRMHKRSRRAVTLPTVKFLEGDL
jgi:hypothetical protein